MTILRHSNKSRIQLFKYFINTNIYHHDNIAAKTLKTQIYFIKILTSELLLNSLLQFERSRSLVVITKDS